MYKFLTTVSISLLLISNAAAQTGTWQNINTPAGIATGFSQMVFVTDTIGYIYGETQSSPHDLERTTDTGVDFSNVTIQTTLKGPTFGYYISWPTPENGYVFADTGQSPTNANFVLRTTNGGMTWLTSQIDASLQLQNLFFPTASVGYATGTLTDGSADFVAKTTDAGNTWNKIYTSPKGYSWGLIGKLFFKDANNGMFLAQGSGNQVNIVYTTNGGTSFQIAPTSSDSAPNFLYWNNDNSWLVGIDSIYRSVDSGKDWTSVVPYDTLAGPATVATFYDSVGFAFRGNEPVVFKTTNYGLTWASGRLPEVGSPAQDTVVPIAASMPSPRVAYLLAFDATNQQNDVLMKIEIPQPATMGVTSIEPQNETSFNVYSDNSWLTFDASSAPEERTIEVVDLLGRECASIALSSNAASSRLASSALQPGSYFARLGSTIVKFNIWE